PDRDHSMHHSIDWRNACMESKTKRERLKSIVLEQEQVRAEIDLLRARSAELDVELDRLLGASSSSGAIAEPRAAGQVTRGRKEVTTGTGTGKRRRRRGAKAAKKPAAAVKQGAKTTAKAAAPKAKTGKAT